MNTSAIYGLLVAICIVGVTMYVVSTNNTGDPDYYENPYYTLTYKESTEDKTLKHYKNGYAVFSPTGLYTQMSYPGTINSWSDQYLGDDGSFIWWDVTIEIYAEPNKAYGFGGGFVCQRNHPNNISDLLYICTNGLDYNDQSYPSIFITDSKGRATLTFPVGVFSDQVYAGFIAHNWGEPKTVTKL